MMKSEHVNFAISSSPETIEDDFDDDEDDEMNENDDETNSRYWLNVPSTLVQIRRLSDQGLRNAKQQFRRLSSSSSKLLKNSYLHRVLNDSAASGTSHGTIRRGSVDPMSSILKAQDGLNYCSKNHGVGFARKSVSFCQRDNVHVYEKDDYEDDNGGAIATTTLQGRYQ